MSIMREPKLSPSLYPPSPVSRDGLNDDGVTNAGTNAGSSFSWIRRHSINNNNAGTNAGTNASTTKHGGRGLRGCRGGYCRGRASDGRGGFERPGRLAKEHDVPERGGEGEEKADTGRKVERGTFLKIKNKIKRF